MRSPNGPTRRFIPHPFYEVQWRGTNQAEIDAMHGAGWERHLIDGGHPLLVGHWLLRLVGKSGLYVASSRSRNDQTEPIPESEGSGVQAALDTLDDLVSDLGSLSVEDLEAVSAWANNTLLDIMRHQRIRGGSRG